MTFTQAILQFPTGVFTVGVGISLVYWLFVLLGALDLELEVDIKADIKADLGDVSWWDWLGLGVVPITISASLVLLTGWVASFAMMRYSPLLPAVILPLALVLAIVVTRYAVRPLAPLFAIHEGKTNADYVGHSCTITTGHVDADFGQATVEDGGTVLVIAVRCDQPDALARGGRALICEFDPERQAYVVEPEPRSL